MFITVRRALIVALALVLTSASSVALDAGSRPPDEGPPPIEVDVPRVAPRGVPVSVTLRGADSLPEHGVAFEVVDVEGRTVAAGRLEPGASLATELPADRHGDRFEIRAPGSYHGGVELRVRTIPGWMTLLPPLIAIVLALALRQVVPALLAGVWIGAWMVFGGAFSGLLRTLDHYLVGELADGDHVTLVLFTLLLGGMVGIISRSGGTLGLVESLRPYATTSRRGQLVTWGLGILIFFDDYANTLLVGNSMRPVTDRLRISREKLAYIVDSTAAPVAAIGIVSTWIGYELSLIGDALTAAGSQRDAYGVFLQALPYNFYPILALVFGLMIAGTMRDFGPMRRAELRARAGRVLGETAVPLADFDSESLQPMGDGSHRWYNAVLPILTVLVVTFGSLWITGRASLAADGSPFATAGLLELGIHGIGSVLGSGESYRSLLWASFAGCLMGLALTVSQRIGSVSDAIGAWLGGMKSLMPAMVILILAWSIGQVCEDLQVAAWLSAGLENVLDPRFLPLLVFVLAAVIAFATGTSWATMSILIPIALPLAAQLTRSAAMADPASSRVLLGSVSAVLAGAIFGDHCSPISDTTVLSSMSSGCDHVDHVRTQLPYAIVVALVAVVTGYIPAALGLNPLLCLVLGTGLLGAILFWIGRPTED